MEVEHLGGVRVRRLEPLGRSGLTAGALGRSRPGGRLPPAGLRAGARLHYDVAANRKVILENRTSATTAARFTRALPAAAGVSPRRRRPRWESGIPTARRYTFTSTGTTRRGRSRASPGLSVPGTGRAGAAEPDALPVADHVAAFTVCRVRGADHGALRLPVPPGRACPPGSRPSDAVGFWDLVKRQDWPICEQVEDGMARAGSPSATWPRWRSPARRWPLRDRAAADEPPSAGVGQDDEGDGAAEDWERAPASAPRCGDRRRRPQRPGRRGLPGQARPDAPRERRDVVGGAAVSEHPFGPDYTVTSLSYVVSCCPPPAPRPGPGAARLPRLPAGPYFAPRADGRYLRLPGRPGERHAEIAKFSTRTRTPTQARRRAGQDRPGARAAAGPGPALLGSRRPRSCEAGRRCASCAAWTSAACRRDPADHGEHRRPARPTTSPATRCSACSRCPGSSARGRGRGRPGTAYVTLHHNIGDADGQMGSWGFPRGGMGAVTPRCGRGRVVRRRDPDQRRGGADPHGARAGSPG